LSPQTDAHLRPTARILLTGATGQVGEALLRTLDPLGEVIAPGRDRLDLAQPDSIRAAVRELAPSWIVNPAAYTAVDKAESEPELAFAVNSTAPGVLAEEAARIGAGLIHFSTDYVFDGSKASSYVETDATAPINVYGCSKLAGEKAVADNSDMFLIFRTSWVYGATGKNFLRTILRLARERDALRIIGDQHGAPTWSYDLAQMTAHVIKRTDAAGGPQEVLRQDSGVYHASSSGETTWFGFAAAALEDLRRAYPSQPLAAVEAISTSEYPTPARRPINSRLDCGLLADRLGWRMPDWRESLHQVMDEISSSD
jgi:dTDP-4-dehydrorhamnose reductase